VAQGDDTECCKFFQRIKGIIHDNENTVTGNFRGQTGFKICHNHSWLLFNAGLDDFMDKKLLVSKL